MAVENKSQAQPEEMAETPTEPKPVRFYARRPGGFTFKLNLETSLYILIVIFVILTRFNDLGSRALHHDEGVHAFYSDRLFLGGGYEQEPWKHGPFLYHVTALIFWLFGVSVSTARAGAAIFGVLVVLLPLLARRELGRWGALTASFLLAVSPMFLYYSRFLREDIFTAFFTLALALGIFRFVDRPSARWWYFSLAALALLFCNKETSFFTLAIFGGFLLAWTCWQFAPRLLLILGICGVASLAAFFFMVNLYTPPQIPFEQPTPDQIQAYIGKMLVHPVFWTMVIVTIASLGVAGYAFREVAVERRNYLVRTGVVEPDTSAATALFYPYEPGTPAYAFGWLGRNKQVMWLGLGLAFAIYSVLYTGFFSSPAQGEVGLVSGLFYWIGQQGVERGAQPWFYYFFILPLYEPLAVIFGVLSSGYILWKTFKYGFKRKYRTVLVEVPALPQDEELDAPGDAAQNPGQPRLMEERIPVKSRGNSLWPGRRRRVVHPYFAPLFMVCWAFANFTVYSWAGEKMPWLTMHLALPFILLSAYLIRRIWEGLEEYLTGPESRERILFHVKSRVFFWALAGSLLFVGLLAYMATLFVFTNPVLSTPKGSQFVLLIPILLALFLVLVAAAFIGLKTSLFTGGAVAFGLLSVFLLHTGFSYAYTHSDIPLEMGIYTQTSPDVTRVVNEISLVSTILPQGKRVPILYDGDGRAPLDFYFRDYPNRKLVKDFNPETLAAAGVDDVKNYPLIIAFTDKREQLTAALGDKYVRRTYAFRWWFGEDQYRTFVPAADREIAFLTNKVNKTAVKSADGQTVVNAGETLSVARLNQLKDVKGMLDKLYNANGGNSTALNLQLALQSTGTALTGDNLARLWRFVIYREMPEAIGSTDFDLYISKDIIGLYRQYGDLYNPPLDRY